MEANTLTGKDVCVIFVESCYADILLDMTWKEVLESNIDGSTDETWEDWFEKYDDSVYDYCHQFHRTNRIYVQIAINNININPSISTTGVGGF